MIWFLLFFAVGLWLYNHRMTEPNVWAQTERDPAGCCDPESRQFCDDGYVVWTAWCRAQINAFSRRDFTGYESGRRAWEAHMREGRR